MFAEELEENIVRPMERVVNSSFKRVKMKNWK